MLFEKLNIIEPIRRALKEEGYTTPTPIQQESIPVALKHRDLLACAQTGTGKTAAFAIPILQLLHSDRPHDGSQRQIKALVLTPTRELAVQIADSFEAYGRYTNLRHTVVFGGVSQHGQTQELKRGVDILIATPGRLLDLMSQKFINLSYIRFFVLDEADRMLDMGFINDVKKVITKLPAKKQTLFFSATMPPEIAKLADSILHEPVNVEVTPVSSTVEKIQQSVYYVSKADKKNLLLHIFKDKSINSALIFTRTKHGADKITRDLLKANLKAAAIHGNKSQNARQTALNNFKDGKIKILVATDIAARGIDIDGLTHVINYELPHVPETYVHRIGRTGRAGMSGIALSFCDKEEKPLLKDILKLTATHIKVVEEHPYPMANTPEVPDYAKPKADKKKFGSERKSFGDKKPFEKKAFNPDKKKFDGDKKPFEKKAFDPAKKKFEGDAKPFEKKKFEGEKKQFGGSKPAFKPKSKSSTHTTSKSETFGSGKPAAKKGFKKNFKKKWGGGPKNY